MIDKIISLVFERRPPFLHKKALLIGIVIALIVVPCIILFVYGNDVPLNQNSNLMVNESTHNVAAQNMATWILKQGRLRLRSNEFTRAVDVSGIAEFMDGCTDRVRDFLNELRGKIREQSAKSDMFEQDALNAVDAGQAAIFSQRIERLKSLEEDAWRLCSD